MKDLLPKAIIFDWDNTLIDSWPVIHKAINETMKEMNKKIWSLEKVKTDIHKSMRESFPKLFGDDWQKAGKIYRSNYHNNNLDNIQFLPGALELIDLLLENKIPLFVISNKIGDTLRAEGESLGVKNKFLEFVGAGDAKFDKPHKAPVDLALKNHHLDPEKDLIWFIGDTITDIECGINSSCQPVLYGEGKNVPIEYRPKLVFKNHEEILNYFRNFL